MMQRIVRVAAVCALALTACDSPTPVDGGPIGIDSGPNLVDSGPIGVDAGPNPVDAGPNPVDAGPISDDAGPDSGIPVDAGPQVDSGIRVDAGPQVDAGPDTDAGSCVAATCGINECGVGVRDNGCGQALDCGPCAIGGACNDGTGCSTGECIEEGVSAWNDGYCTATCSTDADCGAGAHCGFIDGLTLEGACVANCGTPGDCRGAGYSCRDADGDAVNECVAHGTGAGAVGDPCTSLADCGGGPDAICVVDANGWQNGYCSRNCTSDTMCPGNSHCGNQADMGTAGLCVRNCGTNAGCRSAGYRCWDGDQETTGPAPGTPNPSNECWPAGTGTTPNGGACDAVYECMGEENATCQGGTAFFEGYCGEVGCTTDGDCGAGGRCITGLGAAGNINLCGQACTSSTECRGEGYSCRDVDGNNNSECWFSATNTAASVGDPCTALWECGGGDTGNCIVEAVTSGLISTGGPSALPGVSPNFLDGFCTDAATTCPTGSHSVTLGANTLCLPNCMNAGDCRGSGYECTDLDGAGGLECWPNANGAGAVGAACDTYADCSGGQNGACLRLGGANPWALGYCTFLVPNCAGGGCPGGTVCVELFGAGFGGYCLDACTVDTECRQDPEGYECVNDVVCAPPQP